jgi:hypothetical protein
MLFIFFILIIIYIYTYYAKAQKKISVEHYDPFDRNKQIADVLGRMKYISNYNNNLYKDLYTTVNKVLNTYYKLINDNSSVKMDDLSLYKEKLASIYEELLLNLPYKYYDRLNEHIGELNRKIDEKMDLIKYKSSRIPIKISLMNYKSSA